MDELIFEVTQEADGGYVAECLTENIFTQGDSWEELRNNVKEAVNAFFFDQSAPGRYGFTLCETKCSPCDETAAGPDRRSAHRRAVSQLGLRPGE